MKAKKENISTYTGRNPILKVYYWFRNYWYYYKLPILFISIGVVVVLSVLGTALFKEKADYTVVVVSQLGVNMEDQEVLHQNFESRLPDITGNGNVKINVSCINISEEPTSEFDIAAYDALTGMLVFDEVTFLVADDYCVRYLQEIGAIEPLAVLGLEGGEDEYQIKITDTALMQGTKIGTYQDYYLVVKRYSDVDAGEEKYEARRDGIKLLLDEVLD